LGRSLGIIYCHISTAARCLFYHWRVSIS